MERKRSPDAAGSRGVSKRAYAKSPPQEGSRGKRIERYDGASTEGPRQSKVMEEKHMYKTGVYFGRFCPPHRGHLYQIIEASTQCEMLIVVISDNANQTREICESANLPYISYQLR
ncbi:MAG: adenylyltransferase/cytidyltransferase family protein, partial [Clostridia bacterium]|nr:adenylyltransferase/cytidyltransferase family protein [Clostridia bacterium]